MKQDFKSLFNSTSILDTNVLSDLDDINALSLPRKIFSKAYISKNIQIEELGEELSEKVNMLEYEPAHLDTTDGYEKFMLLKQTYQKLSISDIIVVCIAYENKYLCCTNDRRARNACEDLEVKVAGTIGILACAYENSIITFEEFCTLFNNYIGISLRLDPKIIDPIRKMYNIPISSDEAAFGDQN